MSLIKVILLIGMGLSIAIACLGIWGMIELIKGKE